MQDDNYEIKNNIVSIKNIGPKTKEIVYKYSKKKLNNEAYIINNLKNILDNSKIINNNRIKINLKFHCLVQLRKNLKI